MMSLFYKLEQRNGSYISAAEIYDGFQRVCTEKVALFISEDITPFDRNEIECKIVSLPRTYFQEALLFVMQPDYPYYVIFNTR